MLIILLKWTNHLLTLGCSCGGSFADWWKTKWKFKNRSANKFNFNVFSHFTKTCSCIITQMIKPTSILAIFFIFYLKTSFQEYSKLKLNKVLGWLLPNFTKMDYLWCKMRTKRIIGYLLLFHNRWDEYWLLQKVNFGLNLHHPSILILKKCETVHKCLKMKKLVINHF